MARRRRGNRAQPHLEISLTPLIDTVLTLLIIFMVTTPIIHNSIKIDLPRGAAKEGGAESHDLVVLIDKEESIFLNNEKVGLEDLPERLKKQLAAMPRKADQRVWVKIDRNKSCSAGILISTIDRIKVLAGVKDVAIATEAITL